MTNIEKIKNMSPEEMVDYLQCPNELYAKRVHCLIYDGILPNLENCRTCIIKWLLQEASDD